MRLGPVPAGPVHSCVGAAGRFVAVCCVRGGGVRGIKSSSSEVKSARVSPCDRNRKRSDNEHGNDFVFTVPLSPNSLIVIFLAFLIILVIRLPVTVDFS